MIFEASKMTDNSTVYDGIEDGEDGHQALSAAEVLSKVEELWVTEMLSPTLEEHQSELVDCLLDQVKNMDENLKRCNKTGFRVLVHKMELERIRYVLCSYLRCRLQKIERFAHYLLRKHSTLTDPGMALLSPSELQFCQEYVDALESHFTRVALQHIVNPKIRRFDTEKNCVKPNLDAYVFLKVKKNCPGVLIRDETEGRDEEVDLEEGGQHLMTYRSVQLLLQAGDVTLL